MTINESGLSMVIINSHKQEVKESHKWVTGNGATTSMVQGLFLALEAFGCGISALPRVKRAIAPALVFGGVKGVPLNSILVAAALPNTT